MQTTNFAMTAPFDDLHTASADEHLRVTDTLLRFGAGVDRTNTRLIASAFTDEAVVDFGPCGQKLELDFPKITGGPAIVSFLETTARTQTTSHVVSNARVRTKGSTAKLSALVDATHISKSDSSRRFKMLNWYELELVKDEQLWRATRLVIDNVWFVGDATVLSERG